MWWHVLVSANSVSVVPWERCLRDELGLLLSLDRRKREQWTLAAAIEGDDAMVSALHYEDLYEWLDHFLSGFDMSVIGDQDMPILDPILLETIRTREKRMAERASRSERVLRAAAVHAYGRGRRE